MQEIGMGFTCLGKECQVVVRWWLVPRHHVKCDKKGPCFTVSCGLSKQSVDTIGLRSFAVGGKLLQSAAEMSARVLGVDDEMLEYTNLLRNGVLKAYSGIFHGFKNSPKTQLLMPYAPHILQFLDSVYMEKDMYMLDIMDDAVTKTVIGVLGDLADTLGPGFGMFLLQIYWTWMAHLIIPQRVVDHQWESDLFTIAGAQVSAQQWTYAQESLLGLEKANVASVDSINVRDGMKTNKMIRDRLSSAASATLGEVDDANKSHLIASVDYSLKLDHDAYCNMDYMIVPCCGDMKELKSSHYHKTVEIIENVWKCLEQEFWWFSFEPEVPQDGFYW